MRVRCFPLPSRVPPVGDRLWVGLVVMSLMVAACGSGNEFPSGRFVHETNPSWAFDFNEDGTWAFYFGDLGAPEVEGTYSIDGHLYTEETVTDPTCPVPATYRWTYEGDALSFELSGDDPCEPRTRTYDGQTYAKSG